MRVIAGEKRSMPLKSPKGEHTRPTQDRTKETLFNVLQNEIPGCEFLDLFSGSGAIAIEALSRGARHAILVDQDKEALACIHDNLNFTGLSERGEVLSMDVLSALQRLSGHGPFDVIFMDPPYDLLIEPRVFAILAEAKFCDEYTTIVVEARLDRDWSFLKECGFEVYKVKKYKTNQHVFIRRI